MSTLYSNPLTYQTRAIGGSGGYPWMYPLWEATNDFRYATDVTNLTWRVVGSGVTAPSALGVTVPGGALSYTLGAVNDAEVGYQDVGQVYQCKAGTMVEHAVHTSIPTPEDIGYMFGFLAAQGATLISAPQDGIVIYSEPGSTDVEIRLYKSGTVEQTITTDAVVGTDPLVLALSINYNANDATCYVRLAVNGRPVKLNGTAEAVALVTADLPTAALLATGGILQPAADAASVNWRLLTVSTIGPRYYNGGVFGFGDNTGSGSGSGSGTSSGGGLGMDGIGAIE